MPLNRQALIRYRTIDACLRRATHHWTLEDLIEACSVALAEATGKPKKISKRTLQRDLEYLRKDLQAPIEVENQRFYYYSDINFSLEKVPLNDDDIIVLLEIRGILQTFQEFEQIRELDKLIGKVEQSLQKFYPRRQGVIQFEHEVRVLGREHLPLLHRAILEEFTIQLTYQPFKAVQPHQVEISPYLLKEYNSRWYVLAYSHPRAELSIFALDRITHIGVSQLSFHPPKGLGVERYFQNRIGISAPPEAKLDTIELWIAPQQAPYIKSRPIHPSQCILSDDESGLILRLRLISNYELTARILSFGSGVKVLSPAYLAAQVADTLQAAAAIYFA